MAGFVSSANHLISPQTISHQTLDQLGTRGPQFIMKLWLQFARASSSATIIVISNFFFLFLLGAFVKLAIQERIAKINTYRAIRRRVGMMVCAVKSTRSPTNANVQQVSGNRLITAVCVLGLHPVGVIRCICLSLLNWLICSSWSVVVVRFNAFPIVVYSVYHVAAPTPLQNLGLRILLVNYLF